MDSLDLTRKDEKAGLLGQTIELQTPVKAHRKRFRCLHFVHATFLILLLLFWWSFQSISSLVQSRPQPQTNDQVATGNVDFADVRPSNAQVVSITTDHLTDYSQREVRMASMFLQPSLRSPYGTYGLQSTSERVG